MTTGSIFWDVVIVLGVALCVVLWIFLGVMDAGSKRELEQYDREQAAQYRAAGKIEIAEAYERLLPEAAAAAPAAPSGGKADRIDGFVERHFGPWLEKNFGVGGERVFAADLGRWPRVWKLTDGRYFL